MIHCRCRVTVNLIARFIISVIASFAVRFMVRFTVKFAVRFWAADVDDRLLGTIDDSLCHITAIILVSMAVL